MSFRIWSSRNAPDGVEYIERSPRDGEHTAYTVGLTTGLLLGRVYRVWYPAILARPWWAVGHTSGTQRYRFGPFTTRRDAMACLANIERDGQWPENALIKRALR